MRQSTYGRRHFEPLRRQRCSRSNGYLSKRYACRHPLLQQMHGDFFHEAA
jgi:hypothetical protein